MLTLAAMAEERKFLTQLARGQIVVFNSVVQGCYGKLGST
jgi:hypothetical protein